jgi:hypothetical protein
LGEEKEGKRPKVVKEGKEGAWPAPHSQKAREGLGQQERRNLDGRDPHGGHCAGISDTRHVWSNIMIGAGIYIEETFWSKKKARILIIFGGSRTHGATAWPKPWKAFQSITPLILVRHSAASKSCAAGQSRTIGMLWQARYKERCWLLIVPSQVGQQPRGMYPILNAMILINQTRVQGQRK